MGYIYCWASGSCINIDAEKAWEELHSLSDTTPESVLEKARDENSVLHGYFEWDNDVAAEKYRLIQARKIIVSIKRYEDTEEKENSKRVFEISPEKGVYKERSYFTVNKDAYDYLLKEALSELRKIRKRYESIVELGEVFEAIDNL